MEIAYLMAGKRFQARDVTDLNQQLMRYNLVSGLERAFERNPAGF